MLGAVAVRPDGSILLAGKTTGTWAMSYSGDVDDVMDYAAVLVDGSVLATPSPEATKTWTPSPTTTPSIAPTSLPQSAPTSAPKATLGPLSVPSSPTNFIQMDTPRPTYIAHLTTTSSSTSLGLIVWGVAGVAVVLAILVVLVTMKSSRSRGHRNSGTITVNLAASRHFPAAVRPVDIQMPLPLSHSEGRTPRS